MKQYRLLSYTNKLITVNYLQFLLYSERKVIIYRKLMIQLDARPNVSSHHGIPLSVIQEKNLDCQVHQNMKLNLDYKVIVTVRQFR